MSFTQNKGQWTDNIVYKTPLNFGNIYYEKDNFTFVLYNTPHSHQEGDFEPEEEEHFNGHHFKMNFLNATTSSITSIGEASSSYKNYFLGDDTDKWTNFVYDYQAILYQDLYSGINMKVAGQGENMKYEYYVAPNADPNQILVQYLGVHNLKVEKGNLVYSTSVSDIIELAPFVYQNINGEKIEVKAEYVLNKKTATVHFDFPEGYYSNYELVIDPTLIFSRLTESAANVFGFTATYDDLGRAYGGGLVFGTTGIYPTTIGAYDETFNGGAIDIGISCYHQTTGALIYSSFIGGNSNEIPNSMIVNNAGELVVLGTTSSLDFPTSTTAFDTSFNGGISVNYASNGANFENGSDIVVFKLSNDGSSLNSSTYLGGSLNDGLNDDTINQFSYDGSDLFFNYGDVFRGEVIIDVNDNIYITSSTNSSDYPTQGTPTSLSGAQDVILTKLNTNLTSLLFSRYLGGNDDDGGYSMKIDGLGNLIVVGGTKSLDFPSTPGSLNPLYQGGDADGFICKLDSLNGNIIASTFIGTSDYDQVFLIDLDFNNNIYVVGQSLASYPIFNATAGQVNTKQFIVELDNNLNTTILSTTFGASQTAVDISPTALLVDLCGNIYVSGWGGSTNQNRNPTFTNPVISGLPTTPDAFQSNINGIGDFYFIVFDKDVSSILYGSYFGGSGAEHVDGGTSRFDRNGVIYQAVCASCGGGTFQVTPGFSNNTNPTGLCNIGLIKMDVYIPTSIVDVDAFPIATGCKPLTVNFSSNVQNVNVFHWDFGNGDTSILQNPTYTYNDTGVFDIVLIGSDSTNCNGTDTAYLQVFVGEDTLQANFLDSLISDCDNLNITTSAPNYSTTEHFWDMGDGTLYFTESINHTYLNPGSYTIRLLVTDSTSCELRDSSETTIYFPPTLDLNINSSDTTGCVPLTIDFTSSYSSFDSLIWDFGNGVTNNDTTDFSITYTNAGSFQVSLIIIDSSTCNISDTAITTIVLFDDSVFADITLDSIFYECDSMLFTVTSNNLTATSYFWDFGNGTTTNTANAQTTYTEGFYQGFYILTDTSIVCRPSDTIPFSINLLPRLIVDFTANDLGCIPLSIPFTNLSNIPTSDYFWDFGDDSTSTLFNPVHTYNDVGIYNIELYATDTNTCNYSDTATFVIEAINDSVQSGITLDSLFYECDSMLFTVTSNNLTATSYFWDFGNGTTANTPNAQTTYNEGFYQGFYILTDTSIVCRPSDTIPFSINLLPRLIVDFTANDLGCIPLSIPFTNLSNIPTSDYFWDFGDDSTSTLFNPVHTYNDVGIYNIELYATDTNTCNYSDTATFVIEAINDEAYADIEVIPTFFGCDSIVVQLSSFYPTGTHEWDMGNGDVIFGQFTSYTYYQLGTYAIEYTITDGLQICDSIDRDTFFVDFHRIETQFTASDTAGCIPLEVDFNNLTQGADSFWWNTSLSSGGISANLPSLIYNSVGTYPFTLVAYDSTSCNLQDTAIINIITRDDFVTANFSSDVLNACDSLLIISTENTSTNAINYLWDYETNTSISENIDTVSYTTPGTYTITLIAENPNLCHPLDTFSQSFELLPNAYADFRVSPSCEADLISLENLSNPNASYLWDFGNGTTSTEFEPEQAYPSEGVYTISLSILDTNTCDASQLTTQTVDIYSYPTADFTTDSNYYLYPDEVAFYNQSFGYDRYVWEFGDGNSDSIELNPIHFYESLYEFKPCLSVWNEVCQDTICKEIYIDFIPLIGVPNAFSPNNDGSNDVIYVEGIGIEFLVFKIYNRWGEIVFETTNQSIGWDGVYNGTPQEMEVYTYIVNAVFIDGSEQVVKGNITLLR